MFIVKDFFKDEACAWNRFGKSHCMIQKLKSFFFVIKCFLTTMIFFANLNGVSFNTRMLIFDFGKFPLLVYDTRTDHPMTGCQRNGTGRTKF